MRIEKHSYCEEHMSKYNLENLKQLDEITCYVDASTITKYAEASGDHNRIHYDEKFARTTEFGGIIAHGMFTLNLISQMLDLKFGMDWLVGGSLKVKFKGAARLDDIIHSWGSLKSIKPQDEKMILTLDIGVKNRKDLSELITGTAIIKMEKSRVDENTE